MPDRGQPEIDFDRLNLLGKAVFVTGTTLRVIGNVLDSVVETLTGVAREAEKAFRAGLDADVDDANILEERADRDKS